MSVAGVMVSIAAFQAVDPGSIPGPRNFFTSKKQNKKESLNSLKKLTPEGIEPPIFGSGIRRVTIAPWSQFVNSWSLCGSMDRAPDF